MTVQIFAGRDLQNVVHEPTYSHEFTGLRAICSRLWENFHLQDKVFALVATAKMTEPGRELSPDLVIISEEGMGVVELKHHNGLIDCSELDGSWTAHGKKIDSPGGVNPHRQVQRYALHIREDLINSISRLPGDTEAQRKFIFHTAVCFTNPLADTTWCRRVVAEQYHRVQKKWERFDVLTPEDVVAWAATVRFDQEDVTGFGRHYRLAPEEVSQLAMDFFNAEKWDLMLGLMPPGPAYAYLVVEGLAMPPYRLARDELIIGREWTCGVVIPPEFKRVSKRHARIKRQVDGIYLEDLESSNGTFINQKRINEPTRLDPSQIITLGGKLAGQKVCQLRFVEELQESDTTELATHVETE